jgi:hypothetical protein
VNSFQLCNMNQQSANLLTLSHMEFCKKVIDGLVGYVPEVKRTKFSRCRRLNGRLHLL